MREVFKDKREQRQRQASSGEANPAASHIAGTGGTERGDADTGDAAAAAASAAADDDDDEEDKRGESVRVESGISCQLQSN